MHDWFDWSAYVVGVGIAWLLALGALEAWNRLKPEPPADYTLTLTDPDGIPVKQQKMSVKGASRVINELNTYPHLFK